MLNLVCLNLFCLFSLVFSFQLPYKFFYFLFYYQEEKTYNAMHRLVILLSSFCSSVDWYKFWNSKLISCLSSVQVQRESFISLSYHEIQLELKMNGTHDKLTWCKQNPIELFKFISSETYCIICSWIFSRHLSVFSGVSLIWDVFFKVSNAGSKKMWEAVYRFLFELGSFF